MLYTQHISKIDYLLTNDKLVVVLTDMVLATHILRLAFVRGEVTHMLQRLTPERSASACCLCASAHVISKTDAQCSPLVSVLACSALRLCFGLAADGRLRP